MREGELVNARFPGWTDARALSCVYGGGGLDIIRRLCALLINTKILYSPSARYASACINTLMNLYIPGV